VRVGAALTTTGRVGTTRRLGPGYQDGKVYVRNQRVKPLKRYTGSNLVDVGRRAVHARPPLWGGRATPVPFEDVGMEATRKNCGVLVAMLQGQSWAPTPSIGMW